MSDIGPQRGYRIYLYLLWDGRKVARIEVDDHQERFQFPEVFEPLIPSTHLELRTIAEFAYDDDQKPEQ